MNYHGLQVTTALIDILRGDVCDGETAVAAEIVGISDRSEFMAFLEEEGRPDCEVLFACNWRVHPDTIDWLWEFHQRAMDREAELEYDLMECGV